MYNIVGIYAVFSNLCIVNPFDTLQAYYKIKS